MARVARGPRGICRPRGFCDMLGGRGRAVGGGSDRASSSSS
jgi:hypothetical protein